jgi:fumarate hydratase class II
LAEIALPALQAGSSIMPGKVNPVIPEAVCMVCARVIGNDAAVTIAAQSGNFQLNVMWPVAIQSVLNSLGLLSAASRQLGAQAIARFTVNQARLDDALRRNPILVTALNQRIGYEAGSRIAKRAYAEGRPVLDVAEEDTELSRDELARLLDPAALIRSSGNTAD